MKGEAMEKVPGGKLLRIKTVYDKNIKNVQITGDFFAHPEDCINKIEELLTNLELEFDHEDTIKLLTNFVKDNKYELLGINPEAVVRVFKQTLK